MKKDIFLITVDCLRADFGGVNASDIRNLQQNGLYFKNAYAHSAWTAPSFKSLFASRYPLSNGGTLNVSRYLTISTILKDLGYRRIALLYGNNDFVGRSFGYNKIFDKYWVYDIYKYGFKNRWVREKAKNLAYTVRDYIPSAYYLYLLFNALSYPVKDDEKLFYKQFKDNLNISKNLFLWVHLMDVHEPYYPLDVDKKTLFEKMKIWSKNMTMMPRGKKKGKNKLDEFGVIDNIIGILIEEITGETLKEISKKDAVKWLKRWYQDRVKIAMKKIKDMIDMFYEIRGDGIIILTGDHGQEFLEHGYLGHCIHLYQEIIKIPLIIMGIERKGIVENIVSHGDILPTIASIAGYEGRLDNIIGKNLLNNIPKKRIIIAQTSETVREDIYRVLVTRKMIWEKRKIAVVSDRWKYIMDYATKKEEFYDLKNDPRESNDLSKSEVRAMEDFRLVLQLHSKRLEEEKNIFERIKQIKYQHKDESQA